MLFNRWINDTFYETKRDKKPNFGPSLYKEYKMKYNIARTLKMFLKYFAICKKNLCKISFQ